MAIKEYTKTGEPALWKTQEVEAYLRGLGFLIGPSGIGAGTRTEGNDVVVLVRVDLDANVPDAKLTEALDAFVPAPDPVAEAQMEIRQAVAELRATDEGTETAVMLATMKRVILAYAVTLGV